MTQVNFFRARRLLINFLGVQVRGFNFTFANLKEAKLLNVNVEEFKKNSFFGANLQKAEILCGSLTDHMAKSEMKAIVSIHGAKICTKHHRDPNLIENGHFACNISVKDKWSLLIGNVQVAFSNQYKNECYITLLPNESKAIISQNISLTNIWDTELWPYSHSLLHAHMSVGVSIELIGMSLNGTILNKHTRSEYENCYGLK